MEEKQKEIINLCFDLFNGESKGEVKKHNKSALKLLDIFNEVKENEEYAELLYSSLLNYKDDRVKFEAACCCLKLKIKRHKSKSVLKKIKKNYHKTFIGVSAALVLEYEK